MIEFDNNTFTDTIQAGVSVVDFWAVWCMPCKIFAPVLEELAAETEGVTFGKLNIDDHPELAQQYGIASIPTVIVFKDGSEVERLVGVRPKEEVQAAIGRHL